MHIRTLLILGLTFGLFALYVPTGALAEDGVHYTWFPSSYISYYWKSGYTPGPAYGIQVYDDSYTQSVNSPYTGFPVYAETNNFTNPTYYFESEVITALWYLPPDNATVIAVWLTAQFTTTVPEDFQFRLSTDNKASWDLSSIYYDYPTGSINWNVTSLYAWTPAMLNTTDLWVRAWMVTDTGITHYLDYLGIVVFWDGWADEEAEYEPPPPVPDENETGGAQLDYNFIYTAEGIIGIMGFIGLIGMIAVPALSIFVYRQNQGEGKMNIFIKMLVLFMFCLTCFMVSVSGA